MTPRCVAWNPCLRARCGARAPRQLSARNHGCDQRAPRAQGRSDAARHDARPGRALRIGYQNRPDIFARDPPAAAAVCIVVEADERIDAGGTVLTALDEIPLRRSLERARASRLLGRHRVHARLPSPAARTASRGHYAVGFQEVSTSPKVAPLLGFVARGDTAVADAYQCLVLLRYVDGFGRDLGRVSRRKRRVHAEQRRADRRSGVSGRQRAAIGARRRRGRNDRGWRRSRTNGSSASIWAARRRT